MRISKILTAALGVVALASCNNEDSFFNDANNFTSTLEVNVAPMIGDDGAITRAGFWVNNNKNYTTWQDGDAVRVYDANLSKYNTYTRASGVFGTTGTQTASDYQLSPASFVTYAGWKEGTGLTALMNIPAELKYGEFEKGENTAYVSNIPLFGKVSSIAGGNLESSNIYLTGFLKVTLKNGYNSGAGIQSIKVTALKWNAGAWAAAGADKPLSGNFDAVLDESDAFGTTVDAQKSKLQKGTEALVNYGYQSEILVKTDNLSNSTDYESLIYIPIIPGTYDRLQIDLCSDNAGATSVLSYAMGKSDNTHGTAKTIKAGHFYANADFIDVDGAAGVYDYVATTDLTKKMEVSYDLIYNLAATTTTEINDYLAMLTSTEGSVTVNVNTANALTVATTSTQPKMNTIFIPKLDGPMTLNIGNGTNNVGMNIAGEDLTITDADGVTDFTQPITINVYKFDAVADKKVIVKTKRPIALAGNFTGLTAATIVEASNTSILSLGTVDAAFTSANKVNVSSDTEHGETAVPEIMVLNVGTSIGDLTNTDGADLYMYNGAITNLNLVKNANQSIEMRGASSITNIVAPIADLTASFQVDVTSYDNATLGTPNEKTTATNKLTYDFTAHVTSLSASAGLAAAQANIYTAAQLLNLATTSVVAPVLKANVIVDADAVAQNKFPITLDANIVADFDGGWKSISGLKNPLFGTLTNGVKNLALTNVEIEATEANIGALAKTFSVGGDKAIENVTVSGTKIGATYSNGGVMDEVYNVGGLFGKVTNTTANKLTIKNCGVTLTEAIQGYYNIGGFIGQAYANGNALSIDIVKKTDGNISANTSNITAFKKSFWAPFGTDMKCGTVGNFIGSLDNAAAEAISVTIGGNNDTFGTFFSPSTDVITNTAMTTESSQAGNGLLEFARNHVKPATVDLPFIGMTGVQFSNGTALGLGQLIGYSEADAIGTITIYNKTNKQVKINNVNKTINYAAAINAYSGNKAADGTDLEF